MRLPVLFQGAGEARLIDAGLIPGGGLQRLEKIGDGDSGDLVEQGELAEFSLKALGRRFDLMRLQVGAEGVDVGLDHEFQLRMNRQVLQQPAVRGGIIQAQF